MRKFDAQEAHARSYVAQHPGVLMVDLAAMLASQFAFKPQQMTGMLSCMLDRHDLYSKRTAHNGRFTYELYACVPPVSDPALLTRRGGVKRKKVNGDYGSNIPGVSAKLALDVVPVGGTLHIHTGPKSETPDGASLPPITGHFTVPVDAPPVTHTAVEDRPLRLGHITIPLNDGSSINILTRDVHEVYLRLKEMFGDAVRW